MFKIVVFDGWHVVSNGGVLVLSHDFRKDFSYFVLLIVLDDCDVVETNLAIDINVWNILIKINEVS